MLSSLLLFYINVLATDRYWLTGDDYRHVSLTMIGCLYANNGEIIVCYACTNN